MELKTASLHLKLKPSRLAHIKKCAKKHNLKHPEYVHRALEFYSGFDTHFLEKIQQASEISKQSMSVVIQQLLTVYMAQDYAIYQVMGKTKTYARAFQFKEDGSLIEGDELSDQVEGEVEVSALGLKKRLEAMSEGNLDSTVISKQEACLIAARL